MDCVSMWLQGWIAAWAVAGALSELWISTLGAEKRTETRWFIAAVPVTCVAVLMSLPVVVGSLIVRGVQHVMRGRG